MAVTMLEIYTRLHEVRFLPFEPEGPAGLEAQRERFESLALPVPADAVIDEVAELPGLRIAVPESDAGRIVLYVHGGAYHLGSTRQFRGFGTDIARFTEATLYSVEWRRAPEHHFPAPIDDTRNAYAWLLEQGHRPEQIAFVGDSSGGNAVLAALLSIREHGLPLPAAVVAMSAWTDLTNSVPSRESRVHRSPGVLPEVLSTYAPSYLGGADPRDPLASPLFGDLAGLPPLLLQVGTEEILYDDSALFVEAARRAGVDATLESGEGMPHVYPIYHANVPESRAAMENLGAFVREHTKTT
ncbi:alpha/beta hydrolase [Nonomuraea sp. NN258]|uniref:alpha/beta hydrolase n=1 Tax=Nonomuraea antri TaxID=2730852 RepID=UPI001569FBD8|nr:alpha/beta hydrolase [Nonomuraea antri]NRQ33110.1 alpha/beta hydrolase [Nonomuraea antri]